MNLEVFKSQQTAKVAVAALRKQGWGVEEVKDSSGNVTEWRCKIPNAYGPVVTRDVDQLMRYAGLGPRKHRT